MIEKIETPFLWNYWEAWEKMLQLTHHFTVTTEKISFWEMM